MLRLGGLTGIVDQFEEAPVSLAPEWCLRRRHKEVPCRRCLEACPTQAITEGEPVALDAERCVGCGLCLHLCPTGAFTGPDGRAGKLPDILASLSDGRVELACGRKDRLALTRAEVSYVVEVKPCLAALSMPTLLAAVVLRTASDPAGRTGVLWLNDEPCVDCPIGSVQGDVQRTAEEANRLLAVFGLGPSVFTYRGSPESLAREPQERLVVQGDLPRYSRRSFFGSLRSQTLRALASVVAESRQEEPLPAVEDKLPQRLPKGRRTLARVLTWPGPPAVGRIDTTGLPFGAVRIGEGCSACALCARFCPSGALAFAGNEGHFAIVFVAVHCLDCAICSLVCPAGVVVLEPEVEARQLVAGTPQTLWSGRLSPCQVCGIPCSAGHDEPLCFVCRRRQEQT